MTSGPAARRGRALRIRAPWFTRVMILSLAGLFLVMGAISVVIGLSFIPESPAGSAVALAIGAAWAGGAEWLRRGVRREGGDPVLMRVRRDEIVVERDGEVLVRVRRDQAGVVVLESFGRAGVMWVTVCGPDGDLVDRWKTGWLGKGSIGAWLVLWRRGWPRAILEDGGRKPRLMLVSKDVPADVRTEWRGGRPDRVLTAAVDAEAGPVDWTAFADHIDSGPRPVSGRWPSPTSPPTEPVTPGTDLRFEVDLPLTWCPLSLVPDIDAVEVPAHVDALIARLPDLAPARQPLLDMFLGWADSARELGATMAAMRYDETEESGVAMATFLAVRVERGADQPIEASLASLREELAPALPNDQYAPHLEEVDVSVGRSLRLHAVRDPSTLPSEHAALRFVIQHWMPIAGRPETLEFEATTSNLATAPQIAADVDAMAASVTITA